MLLNEASESASKGKTNTKIKDTNFHKIHTTLKTKKQIITVIYLTFPQRYVMLK